MVRYRSFPEACIKLRLIGAVLALLITSLSSAGYALSPVYLEPPALPTEVHVQFAVLDIDGIDSSQQTFTANVYFYAQWHDQRLAGTVDQPTPQALDTVWHPKLQVVNQQRLWFTMDPGVTVYPDGRVTYQQRVWGDFSQPMDLRSFPLDRQVFEIRLTVAGSGEDTVKFVLDEAEPSGIANLVSLSDWEIVSHRIDFTAYQPYQGLTATPSVAFQFEARRLFGYYLMKVLLPLLYIVGMSYLIFWIPIDQSSTRISVSITAMLTLIAYRFMVGDLLPKVSYMTRLDTFIMLCATMVFATLIHAALSGALEKKRAAEAMRLDFHARWIFPLVFSGIAIFSYTLW